MVDGVRLGIATAALVPHGALTRCVAAAARQEGLGEGDLLVVVNGGAVRAEAADLWARFGASLWHPGRNIGTCAAWNRACRWAFSRGLDGVLILGDDVELADPRTLARFAEVYAAGGLRQMRFVHPLGFSAVCVTRQVWDEVGGFDEGFWPAYYEDNDYWRRFSLLGIPWEHVLAEPGPVHDGSLSIRTDQDLAAANAVTFGMNRDYFAAKWGGPPLHEVYPVPWNGGRPLDGTRERLAAVYPDIVAKVERAYGPEEPWPW